MKIATIALFALAAVTSGSVSAGEATETYAPGMGEIMGANQMRHAKLLYAGLAHNWDLAEYELDELGEGFSDAVTYHPTFKNGARISELMPRYVTSPLEGLAEAVKARNEAKFVQAFDRLTDACNACHAETGNGSIRIKRPAPGLYSNQNFSPRSK